MFFHDSGRVPSFLGFSSGTSYIFLQTRFQGNSQALPNSKTPEKM